MGHIKTILRGCLHIVMVTSFIFSAHKSFMKYNREEKGISITFSEVEKVQYPSVTVCKRQVFDEKIDYIVLDDTTQIEDIEVAIKEDVTKKTDIFYFVSHPSMTESKHP